MFLVVLLFGYGSKYHHRNSDHLYYIYMSFPRIVQPGLVWSKFSIASCRMFG